MLLCHKNIETFPESTNMAESKNNILIGVTGSVAAIKLDLLVTRLKQEIPESSVTVISTKNALNFFDSAKIDAKVITDEHEWSSWQKVGDPVLHIDICKWGHILAIAPLDANTLAKVACGICDNLLTCVVRAWRRDRPLLFAPAMNSFMYDHPITKQQIKTLCQFGYELIPPVEKHLACGDFGIGAMAPVESIVYCIKERLF